MALALELKNVSKQFGAVQAVKDLTLQVDQGTFLGLVGRNGAGKSTTIKMATGLIEPTSRSISVLGLNLHRQGLEARRLIGVMPEDMALLDLLTGPQVPHLHWTDVRARR